MSEEIKHHGVKGMKWGVRRFQPYAKGSSNAGKFLDVGKKKDSESSQNGNKTNRSVVRETISSKGREISMARAMKEMDSLTSSDAKKVASRAQLETRMKKLSSTNNVGTDADKKAYRLRDQLTDNDLKQEVDRLQIKENMRQSVRGTNQDIINIGKKVAVIAAPLIVQAVVHDGIDKKWLGNKLKETVVNPKDWDRIGREAAKFIDALI